MIEREKVANFKRSVIKELAGACEHIEKEILRLNNESGNVRLS